MSKRSFPRAIIIFGLANTVLGLSGFVSGISALLRPHLSVAQNVYQQVNLPDQSFQWLHIAQIWSPISFAVLLTCGIGLLRRKPWGCNLAIIYGLGSIGFMSISRVINIARIAPHIDQPAVMNIIFGWLVTLILGGIYLGGMVYCLSRPRVKLALTNQTTGAEILEFKPRRRRR